MTQASPDHPWVKASQITYSASIDCAACQKVYSVKEGYGAYPYLVRKDDLIAFQTAKQKRFTAQKAIEGSPQAAALRDRIASTVDAEISMAARHRQLQRLGLTLESLASYRKRPYSGAEAGKQAGGHSLARIGSIPEMGGGDIEFFTDAKATLELLENEERKLEPRPVKTGARWLQA